MPDYRTTPLATEKMPPGIPYIVGNEAAERFSFYGMRTILTIFMVHYLWLMGDRPGEPMSDAEATKRFHDFVFLAYLTPVFGALIADLFFGKFRVIVVLSLVYCLGHGALALMGLFGEANFWLLAGLWLISLGAGGIKPCVSAHVGDQFGLRNRHLLPKVFNWFYWSINLGAFLSTLLTPWLLEWHGPHLAFGVPGALMALATLVFWMGRGRFIHIPAKGWGFVKELFSPVGLKAIAKLLSIYVFVAVFWALFDQTGSSWVLQAENMDRRWLGIEWLPSQVQAINPIMILTFIPLFSYVVYPLIDRFFPLTPLRKISIGLFLTAISFALIAIAQEKIDAGETPTIVWQLVAYAILTAGEVMVSIVCLEFSYTQAPKTMKSVVMAVFWLSVSLGNLFTAAINHFVQVDDPTSRISAVSAEVEHGGFDGKAGTADDIRLTFGEDGKRSSIAFSGKEELERLTDRVIAEIEENQFLALDEKQGDSLADEVEDPWGESYRYELVNRNIVRLRSLGPDGEKGTAWDQGVELTINRPVAETESRISEFFAFLRPEETWIEQRKRELGLATDQEETTMGPTISRRYFVGGGVNLEGASYFWFFTAVMAAAASLFVLVAKLYRPKEYFHDEEIDNEALEEAVGN